MLQNAALADSLKFAYGLASDAQISGPDWIRSKARLYDVVAQVPRGATREQSLAMLQALLQERMQIRAHHEEREISYLALTVAKGGSKMKTAEPDAAPSGPSVPGKIANRQMPMWSPATLLSRFEKNTVLDEPACRAGMKSTSSGALTRQSPDATVEGDKPSLYTALQNQPGLRLDQRKGPVDVLVIDSAEKIPVEN